jgi:SNF2 family DNA or RNA helicase
MKRTYGRLALDGNRWVMTGVQPYAAMQLKRQFPKIPKGTGEPFYFLDRPDTAEDLRWFMARFSMLMKRKDANHLLRASEVFRRRTQEVDAIMRPDWRPDRDTSYAFRKHVVLDPHQIRNIEIASRYGRLLVMDELGAGKTITGIGVPMPNKAYPCAIVVQPHLMTQWQEQIEAFTSLYCHKITRTTPYSVPNAFYYIYSYTQLAGWVDFVNKYPFKSVVFDEIQDLRKGADTAKGKGARVFTQFADVKVGLSATPIYNYGDETFAIVDLLEPGALGTFDEFVEEWCTERANDKWIVDDPDALGSYLVDRHLVTRHKTNRKPVNQQIVHVDFDEEIEAEEMDMMKALAQRVVSGSYMERGKASMELDMMARRVTGLAKARSVAAYVRMVVESGERVILAGWHRDVYEVWLRELKDLNPLMYTGTENPKQKDAVKKACVDGNCRLLIISLRSGAGLDGLQKRFRWVMVGELDWSPKVHEQLIGRVDRPGQTEEVIATFLVTDGGSDPELQAVLGIKDSQGRGITDPLAGAPAIHSDHSRLQSLARMYLAKDKAA